jgi:hypothetical protein
MAGPQNIYDNPEFFAGYVKTPADGYRFERRSGTACVMVNAARFLHRVARSRSGLRVRRFRP